MDSRTREVDDQGLRDTVYHLSSIRRPSASEGEREAAEWIAAKFREAGCTVDIEEERAHGTYWWPIGILTAAAALGGMISLWRSRVLGVLLGGAAAAGIADDIDSGKHVLRHAVLPYHPTWNVIAEAGDAGAEKTLVVMAHHDSAHSGLVFHQGPQKWMWANHPEYLERQTEGVPFWFLVIAGPLLVALGSLLRLRPVVKIGTFLSLGSAAAMVDIGTREVVPGANDNLSAVAVQVELARALQARPLQGLRVLLVSAGSEESLQEGIIAFAKRHFDELPMGRTWFFNLDTVGSPNLRLVEGEGVLQMRMYDSELKDMVVAAADDAGVTLARGGRARASTDAVVPMKAGYPAVLVTSLTDWKALANYHWPTDTADNVDFDTVADAARLTEALARRMASPAS